MILKWMHNILQYGMPYIMVFNLISIIEHFIISNTVVY